jgi:hypothetical protein
MGLVCLAARIPATTLIAVPLTFTIILMCGNVPTLRPIAVLLSGGEHIREADQRHD